MKLIFCEKCQDVIKLHTESDNQLHSCRCGASAGAYQEDGLNAVVKGSCIVLGISNGSFAAAVRAYKKDPDRRANECCGVDFEAFVIPESAKTVWRCDKNEEVEK